MERRFYAAVTFTVITVASTVFLSVLAYDCLNGPKTFHYSCTHKMTGEERSPEKSGENYAISAAIFGVTSLISALAVKWTNERR